MAVARYTVTTDHLVRGLLVGTEAARQRVRIRYVAYALLAGALWAFFRFAGGLDSLYLALVALLFLGLAVLRPTLVRRQYARLVAGRADLGRTMTVRVADGRLVTETEGLQRSEQVLTSLHAVEPHPDGILVQPFPNEYQWIPDAAFDGPDARAAFERALLAGSPLPAVGL